MVHTAPFFIAVLLGAVVHHRLPLRFAPTFFSALSAALLLSVDAPGFVAVLVAGALVYFLAPLRRPVPLLIAGLLIHLAAYKYLPVFLGLKTTLPLGLSFYSFKLIHYAIERGRGTLRPTTLPVFCTWLLSFPTFTAGPIERFDHFEKHRQVRATRDDVVEGLTRLIHGLVKKFVIVELILSELSLDASGKWLITHADTAPVLAVWRFASCSLLHTWIEFSAYCDLAIGASLLFGLRVAENFNWPIFAPNITVFWKRWHMTLAGFCQAYVYLPIMGLTRSPYAAGFATFLATGLWHSGSLNYLLWGLWHGLGVAVFLTWQRTKRVRGWKRWNHKALVPLGTFITFSFVSAGTLLASTSEAGRPLDSLRLMLRFVGVAW